MHDLGGTAAAGMWRIAVARMHCACTRALECSHERVGVRVCVPLGYFICLSCIIAAVRFLQTRPLISLAYAFLLLVVCTVLVGLWVLEVRGSRALALLVG